MQVDLQPIRSQPGGDQSVTPRKWWCGAYVALIAVVFAQPIARLISYSASTELHSHIPLVPLISGYLLYTHRGRLPMESHPSWLPAATLFVFGSVVLLARALWMPMLSMNDELSLVSLACLSFVVAGAFLFLGSKWMVAAAFPFSFLLFVIPMPDSMANVLEVASMKASADVAALFLSMSGTPFVREEQVFALPGIALRVAEECSGIRSSWVLFITSWLASHFFLKSPWRGLVAVLFVIPLGIVRNGFRILVIALLCVHVGPEMIDSVIHKHGGPLFFGLSLGPLFMLVWWLRRSER